MTRLLMSSEDLARVSDAFANVEDSEARHRLIDKHWPVVLYALAIATGFVQRAEEAEGQLSLLG